MPEIKLDNEIFTKILNPLIITEIPEITLLDTNLNNLPTFNALSNLSNTVTTVSNTVTATTIDKYKKFKFTAYMKNSSLTSTKFPEFLSENLNLTDSSDSSNLTDILSNSNITNNTLLVGSDITPKIPIIREFSTFSNRATIKPSFIVSNKEDIIDQIAITTTPKLIGNLQSTSNPRNEDEEGDHGYDGDIPTVTTISASTITTTIIIDTTTADITVPKVRLIFLLNFNLTSYYK